MESHRDSKALYSVYGNNLSALELPVSSSSSPSSSSSTYTLDSDLIKIVDQYRSLVELPWDPPRCDSSAAQCDVPASRVDSSAEESAAKEAVQVANRSNFVKGRVSGSVWEARSGSYTVEDPFSEGARVRYQSVFQEALKHVEEGPEVSEESLEKARLELTSLQETNNGLSAAKRVVRRIARWTTKAWSQKSKTMRGKTTK